MTWVTWYVSGIPDLPLEAIVFDPVPERKTVKIRIHWHLYGEVEEFARRGATVLRELRGWTVLADPEGDEFCVFRVTGRKTGPVRGRKTGPVRGRETGP